MTRGKAIHFYVVYFAGHVLCCVNTFFVDDDGDQSNKETKQKIGGYVLNWRTQHTHTHASADPSGMEEIYGTRQDIGILRIIIIIDTTARDSNHCEIICRPNQKENDTPKRTLREFNDSSR